MSGGWRVGRTAGSSMQRCQHADGVAAAGGSRWGSSMPRHQHRAVLSALLLLVALRAPVWVSRITAQVVSPAAGLPATGRA